ncbi:MAG: protein-glutamate O-methyltransferase CheR [Neomegalonema sp.]|nr:protein-glutamate O-methyltransferase CheR [Neomegalonema sp.]
MTLGLQIEASEPLLTDSEYSRFTEFFYKRTGITFEQSRRAFVEKRLGNRMAATGASAFSEYLSSVRWGAANGEMQELINALTINETYFFREEGQFKALVENALPDITKGRSRSNVIRICSWPCSTGEEIYSIALYLLEYWGAVDEFDIALYGYDIDSNVIDRAKRGAFSKRSISKLPPELLANYFQHDRKEDLYNIVSDLKESVTFETRNVFDPPNLTGDDMYDVVFCRNMLIYFDDKSRRLAVENIFNSMKNNGVLFLGHSERMSRISTLFTPERFGEAFGYRKRF